MSVTQISNIVWKITITLESSLCPFPVSSAPTLRSTFLHKPQVKFACSRTSHKWNHRLYTLLCENSSFSPMFLRFISVALLICSFFCSVEIHFTNVNISRFIHLSLDGLLGCFQFMANMKNFYEYFGTLFYAFISSGSLLRRGIADSLSRLCLVLWHLFPKWLYHFTLILYSPKIFCSVFY